jgi:hypothetical protein
LLTVFAALLRITNPLSEAGLVPKRCNINRAVIPTSRLRVLTAGDLGFGEPEDPQAFAIAEQDWLATPKPLAMDGPEAA